MSLILTIAEAFSHRKCPKRLVDVVHQHDSDQADALWFEGKHWQFVTRSEWEQHRGAFFTFSSDAFKFYFPSILLISLDDANYSFDLTHAAIDVLDRTPNAEYWDEFIQSRFLGFTSAEYDAIKQWLLALADVAAAGDFADALGRCFDTISLLEKKSLAAT